MLIEVLFENPLAFLLLAIPLIYAIVFHEVAHAYTAYLMGDTSQRWQGRLTLNPLSHLDPFGTLALFIFGFGWAKPVQINFYMLRRGRFGFISVSAAGILANVLFAFFSLLLLKVLLPYPGSTVYFLLSYFAKVNLILASFNLLPIPPLDGSKILMGMARGRLRYLLMRLEPYGFYIILLLLIIGLLDPLVRLVRSILLLIIDLLI